MQYVDNQYKWIVVLNRKVALSKLLNAVGHLALGIRERCSDDAANSFHNYEGADGKLMSTISNWPVIVLQSTNSNQLRLLRADSIAAGLACQAFSDTMIGQSAEDQLTKTKTTEEINIEYYAIALFGRGEDLRALTKKFSLFTDTKENSPGHERQSRDEM